MSCRDIKTPHSPNMGDIPKEQLGKDKSGSIVPDPNSDSIGWSGGLNTSRSSSSTPRYGGGIQTNSDNTIRLIKPSAGSSTTADVDRSLSVKGKNSSGNGISSNWTINITGSNSAGRSIISAGAVDVNGQDSNGNSINTTGGVSAAGTITAGGQIESTAGGIKFPDSTVQTTAATGGGSSVFFRISEASTSGVNGTTGGIIIAANWQTIEDPNSGYDINTGTYSIALPGIYMIGANAKAYIPGAPNIFDLPKVELSITVQNNGVALTRQARQTGLAQFSASELNASGAFTVTSIPALVTWGLQVKAPFPPPNMGTGKITLWLTKVSDL